MSKMRLCYEALQEEAKKRGYGGISDWGKNGPKDEYKNYFRELVKNVSTDDLKDWYDEANDHIGYLIYQNYLISNKEELN